MDGLPAAGSWAGLWRDRRRLPELAGMRFNVSEIDLQKAQN